MRLFAVLSPLRGPLHFISLRSRSLSIVDLSVDRRPNHPIVKAQFQNGNSLPNSSINKASALSPLPHSDHVLPSHSFLLVQDHLSPPPLPCLTPLLEGAKRKCSPNRRWVLIARPDWLTVFGRGRSQTNWPITVRVSIVSSPRGRG